MLPPNFRLAHLVISLLLGACSSALAQNLELLAKLGASEVLDGTKKLNAGIVVKWMPPDMKRAAGGEAKLQEMISIQYKRALDAGVTIDHAELGSPAPVTKAGNQVFTFVPYTMVSAGQGRKVTTKSYFLALSYDGGSNWYYADGLRMTPQLLKSLVPAYTGTPSLPQSEHTAN